MQRTVSRSLSLPEASPAARMPRPARCRCAAAAVTDLADTLACPLPWWEVPGGWEHLTAATLRRLGFRG